MTLIFLGFGAFVLSYIGTRTVAAGGLLVGGIILGVNFLERRGRDQINVA